MMNEISILVYIPGYEFILLNVKIFDIEIKIDSDYRFYLS